MNINQFECYKHEFILSEIRRAVDSVNNKIINTAMIEEEIMNDIGRYLKQDEDNYKHKSFIRRRIYQGKTKALRRARKQNAISYLSDITYEDNEGQVVEYEPEDVLADINSQALELKETIELLAQNDRRREAILTAWANGYTDDREISGILADTLGGKSESHRKFIQRFRNACRTQLYAQTI